MKRATWLAKMIGLSVVLITLIPGPAATARSSVKIILFIGDGMGEAQRTAARWASVGQNGLLAMDQLPFGGQAGTRSAGGEITDSAAAATALATGNKTDNGKIGILPDGTVVKTILELAQERGMAVGLVTNVQLADATPAAFAAHVAHRSQMTEIARQMLTHGIDVLLGGGEDEFLPTYETGCYPEPGERDDGHNLIAEAIAAGYTYICDAVALTTLDTDRTTHLLGLFSDETMPRPTTPSLAEMTRVALDILSQDPDGFFLMVEGGQIDRACHGNDAAYAITDTLELDQAVAAAQAFAALYPDTLLIVTADHETGGMSVHLDSNNAPNQDGPFQMPDGTPFYVRWTTTGHTAVDVPVTAQGPWAEELTGRYENTHLFVIMYVKLNNHRYRLFFPFLFR